MPISIFVFFVKYSLHAMRNNIKIQINRLNIHLLSEVKAKFVKYVNGLLLVLTDTYSKLKIFQPNLTSLKLNKLVIFNLEKAI